MSAETLERDLFCAQCGALIDHQTSDAKATGIVGALLEADDISLRDHRGETGCAALEGMRIGDWS